MSIMTSAMRNRTCPLPPAARTVRKSGPRGRLATSVKAAGRQFQASTILLIAGVPQWLFALLPQVIVPPDSAATGLALNATV